MYGYKWLVKKIKVFKNQWQHTNSMRVFAIFHFNLLCLVKPYIYPKSKIWHSFVMNFQTELFPFLFLPWLCLIHSRLFVLPSCLLFPLFCPFTSLGFRHFLPPTPSGMSLVLSCLVVRRPLAGGKHWCPCWHRLH